MPDSATSPNTQAVRLKVDLLPKGPYPDVVILVDVLRATTLTAILFEQGVQTVYISPSLKAARGFAHSQQLLLAGERQGMPPEGFNFGASPAELRRIRFERDIMLTTENGPKALDQVKSAKTVLLGSFYNARAVTALASTLVTEEIAIVCAGQEGNETLEDTACAGFLARLIARDRQVELRDGARMAMALIRAFPDPQEALVQSNAGQLLGKLNLHEDLAIASLISQTAAVPQLAAELSWEGQPVFCLKSGSPDDA